MSWAAEEMAAVDLGDRRLDRRAAALLETMSEHPEKSIPAKSAGHAEMTAAYRFFSNDRVNEQKILSPHRAKTIERMQGEAVVLCVEDTTQLDFSSHESTMGLGPLYKEYRRGLFLHPLLAVTPGGACLGVLGAKFHAREDDRPKLTPGEKAARELEDKESFRWLDGYREVNALAQACTAQLIYVADREGDIEALLAEAQGQRASVILRARHDRMLEDGERMWDTVWNSPALGTVEFEMAARPGRTARGVLQTIRAQEITLPETAKRVDPITVTVVIAHEEHPPAGEEAVSWTLLTTLPVKSLAAARQVVEYYRRRWVIEEFFKVLKSGCAVEKLQLETADRLKKAITLYMIIAYRILFMVKGGRECPDIPCTAIFEEEEWKTAYTYATKKAPPRIPPCLLDVTKMVAKMGGYIESKGRFPGAKTLWIGLGKIRAYLEVSEELSATKLRSKDV
jgi:hypothetical protein